MALLLAPPAIAQIADAEGDADIPCVDITSLDVRGDTQDLTVTLQTSMRPYPPQYRVKGIDVNDLRLCPDGQYEFLIDTNGDGAEDVTLVTFVDRKGHAHTSGADGLQADVDVDAGRIVWTVPNDSLGLADYPANVSIIAQTGIIPSRAQPKLIRRLDTSDDAPTEWTEFMVGADASAILGVAGGELWVSDPASPLDGARLWIPAGALGKATSICFNDVSEAPDLPPGVEFMGPPVKLSPEGLHLERAAVIRLPHLGGGASPAGILLHDFDDSGRFRETLPLLFIDRQSVMATISHFSQVGPARADVRLLSSPSKLIALASPHSYTMTADFLRCAQLADHGVSLYVPNAGGLRPDGTFFAASTVPALASSIGALLTDNPDAAVRLWFNGCQDLRDENGDGINEILKVPCDWLDGFEVAAAAEVVGQARLVADQVFQELAPRGWTLAQIEERIGLFLDIEPSSDTDLIPPAGYVNLLRAIPDEETVAVFAMKLGSNDDNDEAWSWTESTMVQISTAADEVLYGAYDYGQQILVGDSWWERWLAGLRWGCWTSEDCYATRVASDLQRMIKLELGDKTALLLSSMYYGNAHSFAESVKSGVAG
ncbi:MAG: hypothetical protein KBD01_19455, partial [Acidobacteria bacterium]|nr:hypothetical protein [Acidobacteriota bacterium]